MVSTEILLALKNLLLSWGISPNDWYLTGELAVLIGGYPVDYRPGQLDILVCRSAWPWPRPEEQVSVMPDENSQADRDLHVFIAKYGITPDFHPLPHVGIRAEDRFEQTYWYPDENGIRVSYVWTQVYHRQVIIEHYEQHPHLSVDVFAVEKYQRWKKFVSDIIAHAKKIGDQKTIDAGVLSSQAIERAINFFVDDQNHDKNIIKGLGVNGEAIDGEVVHWREGMDCRGKIVILHQVLTAQFPVLRPAAGIIVEQGGLLSHAAILAREYNLPAIVGVKSIFTAIPDGVKEWVNKNIIIFLLKNPPLNWGIF